MKFRMLALSVAAVALTACTSTGTETTSSSQQSSTMVNGQLAEGARMVALTNLHIDPTRKVLYAMNYQLPTVMPVCSEITINDISTKVIKFTYQGVEYRYAWDKYTRGAGQSLTENFSQYFGAKCDQAKIDSLSKVDQEGIATGRPKLGMTKEGVLFAMGRPPIHANPSLESNTWTYWQNKWARKLVVFDESGKIKEIVQ